MRFRAYNVCTLNTIDFGADGIAQQLQYTKYAITADQL